MYVIASQSADWRGNPYSFCGILERYDKVTYYVYILSNITNTTIYTGVTNDLIRRVYEHKHHADPKSFTSQYDVHKLVYYEETSDIYAALEREKQIKGWNRARKNKLVTTKNPKWLDLYESILL